MLRPGALGLFKSVLLCVVNSAFFFFGVVTSGRFWTPGASLLIERN